jgi:hypothetical protein
MSKAMTIAGMVVAGLIGLIFALDLVGGESFGPFGGASKTMDIGALVSAAILGYLSRDAFREAR